MESIPSIQILFVKDSYYIAMSMEVSGNLGIVLNNLKNTSCEVHFLVQLQVEAL